MTGNLKREVMMAAKDISRIDPEQIAYTCSPFHIQSVIEDLIEEMRRLQIVEEASRWRPIETAPKDGTDLLLWCGWCITGFRDENGFWTEDGTQSIQMVTHWIPSPPPPGEEQSNG